MLHFAYSSLYPTISCRTLHRFPFCTHKPDNNVIQFDAPLIGKFYLNERTFLISSRFQVKEYIKFHLAFNTYRQGFKDCPTGSNRDLELVNALFSLTFRPPDSVVFLAPDFHGSGVITLPNFFSHLSQTIFNFFHKLFPQLCLCCDTFYMYVMKHECQNQLSYKLISIN